MHTHKVKVMDFKDRNGKDRSIIKIVCSINKCVGQYPNKPEDYDWNPYIAENKRNKF